jgi:hypothetical protein
MCEQSEVIPGKVLPQYQENLRQINAKPLMTPVGPDVTKERRGFPLIERASVCRRTIVSELNNPRVGGWKRKSV